jgi:hypothetical protein
MRRALSPCVVRPLPCERFRQIKMQQHCLKKLRFNSGVLISTGPGERDKGISVLRKPHIRNPNFPKRLIEKRLPSLTFRIADRDENGAKALAEVEAREINLAEPLQTRFGEELYTQIFTSQRVALAAPTTYCVAQPRTARCP